MGKPNYDTAVNKLCKWRSILAGWIAGTQAMNAGGAQGLRDLMDVRLVLRCEASALAALLIEKKVFTQREFTDQCAVEAALLDKQYERVFPGFRTASFGVEIFDVQIAHETMRQKGFPP